MSKSQLEIRVGLFVAVGLALLAGLMIQFSKGKSIFRSTYDITMNSSNVGGLKSGATVLLSGVTVGHVRNIDLGPRGTNVLIRLEILGQYVIYGDAEFVIEQSGFLGDQYVAIVPTANKVAPLKDGDEVTCEPPFNLQAVARDAAGFLQRIDRTARDLNEALEVVRKVLLNESTLSNLAETASSLRDSAAEARVTIQNVNDVVNSNRIPIATAISNLVVFSDGLDAFAVSANSLVETNTASINESIRNIHESTESLKKLLQKTESGDNLAAAILSDDKLAAQVSQIASNLSLTSSNLNSRGLWGILWKPKPPRPKKSASKVEPLRSPGDPFR
jgi:phospholipid/cholesterol/gamma-HCH transport system substrate-binding protein